MFEYYLKYAKVDSSCNAIYLFASLMVLKRQVSLFLIREMQAGVIFQ